MLLTLTAVQTVATVSLVAYSLINRDKRIKLKCISKTKSGFKHYKYV